MKSRISVAGRFEGRFETEVLKEALSDVAKGKVIVVKCSSTRNNKPRAGAFVGRGVKGKKIRAFDKI